MQRRVKTIFGAGVALAAILWPPGVRANQQPESPIERVQVDAVDLSSIGPDSVQATVRFSAMARKSGKFRSLVFDQLTIDGVWVKAPPVPGPIRLRAGEPVEGLQSLEITLPYRELESLEPLRRIVREGKADVSVNLRAEVELNLFQKLALMTGGAWVPIDTEQQVPVRVPGGSVGRLAALAALTAAEPVWIFGQNATEWRRNRSELAGRARTILPDSLLSLETRYELRSKNGEVAAARHWSAGFSLGDGEVLAPAEAVEPWSFDNAICEALQKGDVELNREAFDIIATPAAGGAAPRRFSLRGRELRVVKTLREEQTAISPASRRAYHIRFRGSDANAAILQIPGWRSAPALPFAPGPASGEWQSAVMVRFERQGGRAVPVLWITEARFEQGRYHIRDPLDATAFGSPLWLSGGVAGVLQSDDSAAEIERTIRKLR